MIRALLIFLMVFIVGIVLFHDASCSLKIAVCKIYYRKSMLWVGRPAKWRGRNTDSFHTDCAGPSIDRILTKP
jgi:hypothetical protein